MVVLMMSHQLQVKCKCAQALLTEDTSRLLPVLGVESSILLAGEADLRSGEPVRIKDLAVRTGVGDVEANGQSGVHVCDKSQSEVGCAGSPSAMKPA